jgi:hypothetical protein
MEQARKDQILEKVAAYSIRRGQGYGSLKRRGFDPAQARAAVQAYYAQRGKKSAMLYAGDSFSRGADGGLVFQRGKKRLTARADHGNKHYAVSRGQGANESLLDRGTFHPMSASRLAQGPKPAAAVAKVTPPPRPPIVGQQPPAVVKAPAAPKSSGGYADAMAQSRGGRLPLQTPGQLRSFTGMAKRHSQVGGGPSAAAVGRLAGNMANQGKTNAGVKPVDPGPANLGATNIAGGPPGIVQAPASSPAIKKRPAARSMVAQGGL